MTIPSSGMTGELFILASYQFRDSSETVPGRLREISECIPKLSRILIGSFTNESASKGDLELNKI
ncbi:MAG: hypothetical protein ACYCZO_15225 [Daejeonella sp.]